ncbi:MFS transporter [Corynebacterium meridianum]|uniref:MFS transporter n=1 Tax=Corynebacterium meridianum TaxID=2765363 RepID=A0A934I793_9CORY|nr:MFS transporter [Corynebacterium meridianum]MBI8989604.1 MFS transporter [Corynebacterium meridianum]
MFTDSRTTRSLRLMALAWCATTAQIGVSAVPVVLPAVAVWSGGDPGTARWLVTAFLRGMTTMGPVFRCLGGILGRDRVLLGAVILFTVTAALCALTPSPGVLIAVRAIRGAAGAALAVLPVAAVRDLLTARRSGSGLGPHGSATAVGTAAGPVLARVLVDATGCRAVFRMLACLSVHRRAAPRDAWRYRWDASGRATSPPPGCRGRGAAHGRGPRVSDGMRRGRGSPARTVGLLTVAVAAPVVLHRIEGRDPRPLPPEWSLGSSAVRRAVTLMVVVGAVMMSPCSSARSVSPPHTVSRHGSSV